MPRMIERWEVTSRWKIGATLVLLVLLGWDLARAGHCSDGSDAARDAGSPGGTGALAQRL